MGSAKDFSKDSCDVSVVTPPCPSTVSSLLQMPGLWAHMPLTQERSHCLGVSAINGPNEREEVDNQLGLAALIGASARSRNMPTAQCIQHFIAIVGKTQAQFSIKYQKRKESGFYQGWQKETSLGTFVWGASMDWHYCACNFLTGWIWGFLVSRYFK